MSKKRYTMEQVIMKLREIEVMTGQGSSVTMACRQADYRAGQSLGKLVYRIVQWQIPG